MTPTMTGPTSNTPTAKAKIRVKLITIHQAEGLTRDLTTTTHETWTDAEKRIRDICHNAPETGGYFKCDFTIIYIDGETYTGRYDAARPTSKSYEGSLSGHVRSHLTFSAGLHRPDHLTEDRYEAYLAEREKANPGFKQTALDFLKGYALTDEEAGPSPAPTNPQPRNDTVNNAATAPTTAPQKSAREAREESIAFAKANNLAMVPITGNTYPVKGLLYVMGGRWDDKIKQWSVPSHKAAEAQAAADKFAKPVKAAPVAAAPAPQPVATPQNLAVANLNAMTPRPAPAAAPKPTKAKPKGAPLSPLQKRLAALLTGAEHVRIDVKAANGDVGGELFFAIEHIKKAIEGLG